MAVFRKYSHSFSCDIYQACKEHIPWSHRVLNRWKGVFLKQLFSGDIPNEPGHLQFFIEQWMIDHQPTAISIDQHSQLGGVQSVYGWPATLPSAIMICPAPTVRAAGLPLPSIFVATNFGSDGSSIRSMSEYVLQREGMSASIQETDQPLIFVNYHDSRETIVTGSRVHTALTEQHILALCEVSSANEYGRHMESVGLDLGVRQEKTLETMYLVHSLVAATLQHVHQYGLPSPGSLWTRIGGKAVRFRNFHL